MTRKHYRMIAADVADQIALHDANYEPIGRAAVVETAERLARTLGRDNPRFDRVTFLTACGIA